MNENIKKLIQKVYKNEFVVPSVCTANLESEITAGSNESQILSAIPVANPNSYSFSVHGNDQVNNKEK